MELLKHINSVVNTFVEQNCIFSELDQAAFEYRVRAISHEISREQIGEMYKKLTERESFDKKSLRQISVSSSIKIVGMAKKYAGISDPRQRIELICLLLFLSEKVVSFNRQVLEIVKVVSSILISREEDFRIMHEMSCTKKCPAVSDEAFSYFVSEPVSLDIRITQSNIILHQKPGEIYCVYKVYSYPELFVLWHKSHSGVKTGNVINVCTAEELAGSLSAQFSIDFQYDQLQYEKLPNNYIHYRGNDQEPEVILDEDNASIEIAGASMPFSAFEFYQPILRWLDRIRVKRPVEFTMKLSLDFFDTQSSKMLLETMRKAAALSNSGVNVVFNWYTEPDDVDMREAGYEYSTILQVPFNYLEKK